MPEKQTSFTYKLDEIQQAILIGILESGNYKRVTVDHTLIAAQQPHCNINLYKSGKCLVQGKDAQDFVMFVLEPMVLHEASVGYEKVISPELAELHMGIDESGKGDLFGPMVICSACIGPEVYDALKKLDVKDSKRITSDKKALGIAAELRKLLRKRYSIVAIGPSAYNRLYAKMRNVNKLLAWGHARSIENLLDDVPSCPRAVSDKFASADVLKRSLMSKGKSIELVQKHKAESDPAVAAASILARAGFLMALKKFEQQYDMEFPKGASAGTREAAVKFVKKHGPAKLAEVAKCHFRTTDEVLAATGHSREDLPEEARAKSAPRRASYKKKSS